MVETSSPLFMVGRRPQLFGRSYEVPIEPDSEQITLENGLKPQGRSSAFKWFPAIIYAVCFLCLLTVVWLLVLNSVIAPYMISTFLRESHWSITRIYLASDDSRIRAGLNILAFRPSFTFEVTNVKHAVQIHVDKPLVRVTNSTGPSWPLEAFTSSLNPGPYGNVLTTRYQGSTAWGLDWLPNASHYEIVFVCLVDVTIFGATRKRCPFTKTFHVDASLVVADLATMFP